MQQMQLKALSRSALLPVALPCYTLPCPALLRPALPCYTLLCSSLPCPARPCPAAPCPALAPARSAQHRKSDPSCHVAAAMSLSCHGCRLLRRLTSGSDLRVRATGKVTLLPDCATTGKNVSLSRQASAGCCTDKAQKVTHVVKRVCTLLAKSICTH